MMMIEKNNILFKPAITKFVVKLIKYSRIYVSNIFEELDLPNEWFVDKDTRNLYFMPNDTMPDVFVAS
jgi:hypothetical protein